MLYFALALAVAALASAFALQNSDSAKVAFLAWEFNASLAVVLFATFALGALGAFLACLPAAFKAKLKIYDLECKIKGLEKLLAKPLDPNATMPRGASNNQ